MRVTTTSSGPSPAVRRRRLLLAVGAAAVIALIVGTMAFGLSGAEVSFEGPDEELINQEGLAELAFEATAEPPEALDEATVTLDGEDVTDQAERDGDTLRYVPGELEDGEHEVEITVAGSGGNDSETWTFIVDATPPELEITEPDGGVVFRNQDTVVAGTTDPDAELELEGETVELDGDGAFEVTFDEPPAETLTLTATDAAGNVTTEQLELTVLRTRIEVDEIRGVHVTGNAWLHDGLRGQVIEMIEDGRINTVQLDVKGESGRIYNSTDIDLANEMEASFEFYDLEDVVDELHDMGVHVIARIVAFRDPYLGEWAQDNGRMELLAQTPDGEPYLGQYPCCFLNFAHQEVIDYNIDLAVEAARAGVDGILWDYVRRPDGDPEGLVYEGLAGDDDDAATLEEAVVDFVAEADERIAPYHVEHGASVYGIAATRPTQIAQDIEAMVHHLDYVAPMLYPTHWGPGEYDVADPVRQPYDIIHRSLEAFLDLAEASGRARVVPWLEDSNYPVSLGVSDRGEYVREQIRASADRDVHEWIMWDSHVNYTVDAYDPVDD
jgi:hypothetical protein